MITNDEEETLTITITPESNLETIKQNLASSFETRARNLVFDLQGFRQVDSIVIGMILLWFIRTRREGLSTIIQGLSEDQKGLFKGIGLGFLLPTV
jgi:anti-anti-sigma regulatory factor